MSGQVSYTQRDRNPDALASLLNKTPRTVERYLKALREQGRIQRVGSDKSGHWKIIERAS